MKKQFSHLSSPPVISVTLWLCPSIHLTSVFFRGFNTTSCGDRYECKITTSSGKHDTAHRWNCGLCLVSTAGINVRYLGTVIRL